MSDAAVAGVAAETTRRRLTARQAAVVDQLVDAAADEARHEGYDGLTVRGVARRAGVAPATAYTYFASKDHLLAEVLWRRLQTLVMPEPDEDASPPERLTAALRALGLFMADDPTLAAACTTALLGSGPEVRAAAAALRRRAARPSCRRPRGRRRRERAAQPRPRLQRRHVVGGHGTRRPSMTSPMRWPTRPG